MPSLLLDRSVQSPTSVSRSLLMVGLFLLLALGAAPATAAEHYIGLGVNFFRTLDDVADDGLDDIDEDGYAFVLSYRYEPQGIFFLEGDVEYYTDGYGGATEASIVPIGYVGIGSRWYAAVGIGTTFADDLSDNSSDPFYVARIGRAFTLLPGIGTDLYLNYRAGSFDALEEADTDAITLGATIRFNL